MPLLMKPLLPLLLLVALLSACAPTRQGSALTDEWIPSPNHGPRRPTMVVLHYTTNNDTETALRTLTHPEREVSAHYLVGRDGRIVQLVDEARRAWHAGASYWQGNQDVNSASIGIELDNNGHEPFPDRQIDALLALLDDLRARYAIAPGTLALRLRSDLSYASVTRTQFAVDTDDLNAALAPETFKLIESNNRIFGDLELLAFAGIVPNAFIGLDVFAMTGDAGSTSTLVPLAGVGLSNW